MVNSKDEDRYLPRVADFYTGKSIFITGASGFVGTILLETLLRCCPGIKSIYILLRSKKNVPPEVRKEQIFSKKIFEKINEENRELLDKVHVMPGDVSLPNLGMSEEDEQLLIDEAAIVIHCAAIIHFTKPLEFTLLHNVLSLNTVIELCRKMRKFEVLVYTSTAFSNCNHPDFIMKEEVYRLPFRAEKFIDALKKEDYESLQDLYSHCQPEWPNTYTFSKCLAENLIMDTASDLPIAIIRPSIVMSSWKNPIPGYVEENSGIAALTIGVGKGFVKVLYADPNCKLNLVPVDIVANTHVIAAWCIGTKRCPSPLVVNCSATDKLNIKLSEYTDTLTELTHQFPLPKAFEVYHHLIIVPYKYLYYIVSLYYHYFPAIVLDGLLKLLGKKSRVYSMYRFYDTMMSTLNFFLFRQFELERTNIQFLDKLLHPEDRKDLSLDFSDATFLNLTLKIPEKSPFYDWKIDKKSPSERKKTKYRRHVLIKSIQVVFLLMVSLLFYWIFSLIFL